MENWNGISLTSDNGEDVLKLVAVKSTARFSRIWYNIFLVRKVSWKSCQNLPSCWVNFKYKKTKGKGKDTKCNQQCWKSFFYSNKQQTFRHWKSFGRKNLILVLKTKTFNRTKIINAEIILSHWTWSLRIFSLWCNWSTTPPSSRHASTCFGNGSADIQASYRFSIWCKPARKRNPTTAESSWHATRMPLPRFRSLRRYQPDQWSVQSPCYLHKDYHRPINMYLYIINMSGNCNFVNSVFL